MALTKDQKQAQVQDLTTMMSEASSVIFANYIGLSVAEISELRNKLREGGAEMKVAKKTLMNIAARDAKLPEFEDASMEGPVSLIFSYGDALSGAQIAFKYSKEHEQVALIGGVFEGNLLSKEEAMELAQMPGKEELLAMFVGMIRSPLVSFAGACSAPLSGFARALSEIAEKGGVHPEVAEEKAAEETEEPSPDPAPTEEPTPNTETPSEDGKKED